MLYWKQRGRGVTLVEAVLRQHMPREPGIVFEVNDDRCFGCAACVALCPVDALTLEGLLAIVDEPACTHCKLCIPSCPVHALSLNTVIPA